jgi:hypothetical protein
MRVQPYDGLGDALDTVISEGNRLLERAFGVTKPEVAFTA